MANASETKVTRREAILTTGKAAVTFGAAALLAGRLPNIQHLHTTHNESDDQDLEIPTGGLATVAVTYTGTDPADSFGVLDTAADGAGGVSTHLVALGLVPIEFVISEIDTNPYLISGAPNPFFGGTPLGNRNTVSVMTVGSKIGDTGRHFFVHVWTDSNGFQAIVLPPSPTRPIVVGTSVDVEALEDAVRASGAFGLAINNATAPGHTYLILALGSLSPNAP